MSDDLLNDLTIVIPTYRCVRYLPATIASALQVPGAPIVIAEDHGEDETLQMAKDFAAKYPERIRVTANEKNLGITGNWQNAVGKVSTPFVVNLCDDDLISTAYLKAAISLMRREPKLSIVGGGLEDVPEDFALDGTLPVDQPVAAGDLQVMGGEELAAFALKWNPYPAASSTVYRMSAWREVGGYDLRLKWCMDREIWFRMSKKYLGAFCPKLCVHYRILNTSVTAHHRRGDLFCYELSHMFRESRKIWQNKELTPLFRRQLLTTSKAFFGSSARALRWGRAGEVIPRMACGFRDLAIAATL